MYKASMMEKAKRRLDRARELADLLFLLVRLELCAS